MKRPFVLGLTGSMGMGKSTAAGFFRDCGVPVWDADEAVARLYARGGAAVGVLAGLRPQAIRDGQVDRAALKEWIQSDPAALDSIEAAVHPLVAADRAAFVQSAARQGAEIVVLDIPLLFEKGHEAGMDAVVVVTAPAEVQRRRVLGRPGMTAKQFELVLSRQMPDAEKRARADYVIPSVSFDETRAAVSDLVRSLRERLGNA